MVPLINLPKLGSHKNSDNKVNTIYEARRLMMFVSLYCMLWYFAGWTPYRTFLDSPGIHLVRIIVYSSIFFKRYWFLVEIALYK